MKRCNLLVTNDEGQVLTQRSWPHEANGKNANAERAVSLLWDYQTRAEMNEDESHRFASAKRMLRKRRFSRAKAILISPRPTCAESFNLLGLIHEALGEFNDARKCYGEASTIERDCTAAQMNARRLYELYTFGHSDIPLYL